KQRALLGLVREVHARLETLLQDGAGIIEVDAVDLAPVLRARYDTPPDGATEVEAIGRQLLKSLEGLRKARET
ncbi:MAG: hypothetical protein ACXVFA_15290, partial [Solirubrobacteraceae bacterium]